jgi:nucleoside 2-deoxyribosyltransferase
MGDRQAEPPTNGVTAEVLAIPVLAGEIEGMADWCRASRAGGAARSSGRLTRPRLGDTPPVKLYFAGPLFTTPERAWNAEVASALRAAGHDVFLPQEKEPGLDAPGIFAADVGGIDWADAMVAIMDGSDPESGTAWEVGYAFGTRKPVVLVRTDLRAHAGDIGDYNAMLTQAATARVDLPAAPTGDVVAAILDALSRMGIEAR